MPTGQYTQLGPVRTRYDERGEGDALVLMHSGLVDDQFFAPNIGPLAERFRVLTPERRVHGHTSDVEEPVEEENQGIAEPAAAEENPKREASPRLKAVRSSTNVSQAETRKLLDDGRDFLRAQRFDEARAAFEQLLHAGKSRGPALVGLAKIAFQQHEYQEAVDRAREAVRAGAGAEARVVLGDAYFRLEKLTEARKAYEDALKLDPENRTARQNLDLVERRSN